MTSLVCVILELPVRLSVRFPHQGNEVSLPPSLFTTIAAPGQKTATWKTPNVDTFCTRKEAGDGQMVWSFGLGGKISLSYPPARSHQRRGERPLVAVGAGHWLVQVVFDPGCTYTHDKTKIGIGIFSKPVGRQPDVWLTVLRVVEMLVWRTVRIRGCVYGSQDRAAGACRRME